MQGEIEMPLIVTSAREVSHGVTELILEHLEGATLPEWTPGSHIDLRLTPHLVRQYSLCGSPTDRSSWRIAVLREPESRGGSAMLGEQVRPGDVLLATGPRNHFKLLPSARYLFIAGGIGITPIIPMIEAPRAAGADWQPLYGGRTKASMAYGNDLHQQDPDRVQQRPQDQFGLLALGALLAEPTDDTLSYCCGPEPLLAAVEMKSSHWPAGALRVERFATNPLLAPVSNDAFEIKLVESEAVLIVPPDKTILEVVDEAGIFVPSNCEEGTCGTCETRVLAGNPDHLDSILDDEERAANDVMMICVSRSLSPRLVLEL